MANAVQFPEADHVQDTDPPGLGGVQPLPVARNGRYQVSCFQLSEEEKREVAETGQVWLAVVVGADDRHPIVRVSGSKTQAFR